jgi:HAD superfamily phosphatase (TIGR01668 family)
MYKKWFPDRYCRSAYEIDYEALYQAGYRGIIYDIDNTLVEHGAPANARAVAHFKRLKEIGFSCCFLSNNGEERVKLFNEQIGVPYIYKAGKPKAEGYEAAIRKMGTSKETTVFIGDQIFTDIWGAKNAGIYCILTEPIDPHEEIQIVLKRYLEKPVLASYQRYIRKQIKG